jgi:hypothetical protein
MTEDPTPGDEDQKLVALARAARVRIGAGTGAAVRDETGRSYTGADVALPSLRLTGLELAVAAAVAAGAQGIEGAAVVGGGGPAEVAVVREVGGVGVPVWLADNAGTIIAMERT